MRGSRHGNRWQAVWLHKQGNAPEEYEDAFAADDAGGLFALADGASESSFAEQWARLLVDCFVGMPEPCAAPWSSWLPALQIAWLQFVGRRTMPWYAEAKIAHGAFSTFLGLELNDATWSAVAVGDSCLFHMRDGMLLHSFPLEHSTDFGLNPGLLGSRMSIMALPSEGPANRRQGPWQKGDQLFLMTDALAQWFLALTEERERPWERINELLRAQEPQGQFAIWIGYLRACGRIRNDDVTLVTIDC